MPGVRGHATQRSANTPGRRTRRSSGVGGLGRAGYRAPPGNSGGPAQAPRSATGPPRTRGMGIRRFRVALPPARRARPAQVRPYRGSVSLYQRSAGHHRSARAPPNRRMRPRKKRKNPGDGLFSRKATLSVSSALESLTSVFGMGTGVASPLESPGSYASGRGVSSRSEFTLRVRFANSVFRQERGCDAQRRRYAAAHRRSSISCCVLCIPDHARTLRIAGEPVGFALAPNPW